MANSFNIKQFLSTVTNQSGIYIMYDQSGTIIYVGKAKDLKKRLSSYFYGQILNRKTEALINNIYHIEVIVTHTETEALLLENNYIKLYQPRYNVLLRDDKSYPFIFLSNDAYPRVVMHRGRKYIKGEYFGPFPNSHAVKKTLILIQKLFPIRQCEDSTYRNRSRPCLQYQINHCLGPCIKGLVSYEEYQQQVSYVRLFLSGENQQVLKYLVKQMELASHNLNFEEAIKIREQIKAVHLVTKNYYISGDCKNLDIIGTSFNSGLVCIHMLFIRHGNILANYNYFLKVAIDIDFSEIVHMFITKFYLKSNKIKSIPEKILLDYKIPENSVLIESIKKQEGKKIYIQTHPRGICARYLKLASTNASIALKTKLSQQLIMHNRLTALAKLLNIKIINRIECFDISHTMGEQTIASCVVFTTDGPVKTEYRRYNIKGIIPADDYSAIDQVLRLRYSKLLQEKKSPDVIIIDGGKGQLKIAKKVFEQLKVPWDKSRVVLLSIAKSRNHEIGFETIFLQPHGNGILLPPDSPALHIIQHIRNESHNHALTGHRNKRAKVKNTSMLEFIDGIGPRRRQLLLKYTGGLQSLRNASIEDIAQIPGISMLLAKKIFNYFKR